jgi:hypothetical protein
MLYKIVRLYESNHQFFRTESFGDVDLRISKTETINETKAADESLKSYNYSSENKNIIRLITILQYDGVKEAIEQANAIFERTIDLYTQYPIAKLYSCNGAGYYEELETGRIFPLLKKQKHDLLGNLYHINQGNFPRLSPQQYIAAGRKDKLVQAYFRSINWFNKSKQQNQKYLKFLFLWISLETMLKNGEEDDGKIVPRICTVLGFPKKSEIKRLPKDFIDRLKAIDKYEFWDKFIFNHIDESRTIRNSIVHSGFKETDIDGKDLSIKIFLLFNAFGCLIKYIEKIILGGVSTLDEALDLLSYELYEDENIFNRLYGNLFYRLNKNDYFFDDND